MENIKTSTFYSEILSRLNGVRRKENHLSLLYGVLVASLLTLTLVLFIILLEQTFTFDSVGRTVLFSIGTLGVLCSVSWCVGRPLLRILRILKSSHNTSLALKVGKHFPGIHDRLLDAMQIYESKNALKQHYSLSLIDASFINLYKQIQPLDFTEAVSDYRINKMRKFLASGLGVLLLVFVISPSGFFGSMYRVVHFNQSFASPLPIQLFVEPGNTEVIRGQNVPIIIRVQGKPIQSLSLLTRQHGQIDFDEINLRSNNNGVFQTEINNIKASTEYYATVEDIKSEKFNITVLDRPLMRSLQVKITPPAYTRISPKMLDENMGDISAYPGSLINLVLTSSKDLSSARIIFNNDVTFPLVISGKDAEGSFTVKNNLTYHILLKDIDGLPNVDPIEYAIRLIPDEYPTTEIISPAKNLDLTEEMKLDLFIRNKDDFGFTKLRLAYRLVQSRYEQPAEEFSFIEVPLPKKDQTTVDVWYTWDFSSLHLVPEDAVAYYVEVFDNDNVSGPKSGKSEMYIVRLPSLEEVFTDVSQAHQQSLESMQSVAKEVQQLKKDIEDLNREMRKNRDKTDWQQQKKAEEMLQRYEAMKKKLEETTQKMDEIMQKMEDNKLLSEKTLEKYLELQKLLEKLNSPELREALKKLQEMMMKQLSPEQLKQAMEQLKLTEEQFRQNLERTIELLKRIHIEQKLDELIKRTEELKKQQEALREQTAQTKPSDRQRRDELAQKQGDLQQQTKSLENETADLTKKMEEFPKEMPVEQMSKAQEQLAQKQLPQKMQQSAQQVQAGNMQGAQENQKQTEQDLSKFAEQLRQVQQSLLDQQMQQIVNEMRKQLQNVLELSKRQESLKDETKGLDPNSQLFREGAQQQSELKDDLGNVANSIGELAKKTFAISPEMGREIGNAMKQMDEALENMENRNPGGSSDKQGDAMGSLNRAAMMMQNALKGLMQEGQSGFGMAGLMGRLGQIGKGQGEINAGTQQTMQGQGMSAAQQAAYQRLAGQQAAVQKSLQELSEEAKNAGEFSKLLGDLDRIAEEMIEVQTDLEQGGVNPETIKKQERILSRLLDSQRSLRERDYEKRRRAESGKNIQRLSPAKIDLTTQEGRNRLREELLKLRDAKYSKDYEELIRKYFEQLEKEEVEQ
ncbi:MAG: hypothetical protein HY707_01430 [Ignavibacteriae bacterium]|nr:hypothetical protein [Ignavibacteriota bacterium]